MCRRFSVCLEELEDEEVYPGITLPESYQSEPGKKAYGITFSTGGVLKAYSLLFGFPSFDGKYLYNARVETAGNKPTFQEDYLHHKVIFPCTSFFEVDRRKEEHEFIANNKSVLYIAGFYNREREFVLLTESGEKYPSFSFPRMPLLLTQKDVVPYLKGENIDKAVKPLLLDEEESQISLF